jgi:signal transduction histidine kinase
MKSLALQRLVRRSPVTAAPLGVGLYPSAPYAVVAAVAAVIAGCFVADVLLPRGATPAIGYCLVPLLAVRTRRLWFILVTMAVCTVLTWAGYYLEPAGAPWWMSVFERWMVTGVLWLTVALCWQRMRTLLALEELSRELARSNADLEAFAVMVAHDLRSPLSAISLFTRLLAGRPAGNGDADPDQWISSIRSEIDRMASLIQRLLAYGRAGSSQSQAAFCDCESILSDVLKSLQANLEASGGEVTHAPLPALFADPTEVAQLLQNLIENAIKYRGDQPPRIHVAAAREEGGWTFSVRDNGIGIDPEDAERVFCWFERGHRSQSRHAGAGIGLAICKRIVERHGGRIWAESSPGRGSTFHFTLPDLSAPAARSHATARVA